MKISIKTGAFLIAIALISFAACKKTAENVTNTLSAEDSNATLDQAQLEKASNDVENVADNAEATGTVNLRLAPGELGGCATVTRDTTSTPHVLTIDFGSTDCLGADGNYRRGKIIVTYTKGYKDSGSSHTISYDHYYFNDNRLTGGKTVTNMGRNTSGKYYYDITVNDTLYLDSTTYATWSGSRVRTWVEGYYTATRMDDQFDIYGTTTVTRPSGRSVTFDVSSSSPLHIAVACRWIESGSMTATRSGGVTYTIDYGTGACDRLATLTIGGKTYHITLR